MASKAIDGIVAEAAAEHEGVAGGTTVHEVIARSTDQHVATCVAVECVGPAVANQSIAIGTTAQRVVTVVAREGIGKRVTGSVDVAGPTLKRQVLDVRAKV
jgi:hypothetical protein